MILAMIVGYCFILYLLFDVFKVVKSTTRNRIYVTLIGIFMIICVLFFINWYQPMSTDVRVYRYTVPVGSRVSGRVIEVPVEMDVPVKAGDVLFRVDPAPYEAEVKRLEAALADAEQRARMLPVELEAAKTAVARARANVVDAEQQVESLGAKLKGSKATVARLFAEVELAQSIYDRDLEIHRLNPVAIAEQELETHLAKVQSAKAALEEGKALQDQVQLAFGARIDGVNTIVLQAREALAAAKASEAKARLALEATIDGENTVVAQARAALANARINLEDTIVRAPADGFLPDVALRPGQYLNASGAPVMTFVNSEEHVIVASFPQVVLGNIATEDPVEIAFDDLPGYTFSGKVKTVSWGIRQGQVVPGGQIVDAKPIPHGRFFVELEMDDKDKLRLPAGEAGAATVYTQFGKPFIPVRKVFFRWYTWVNYIITDMDIRGLRD